MRSGKYQVWLGKSRKGSCFLPIHVLNSPIEFSGFDLDRGKLGHGARIPRDRVETARGGREEGDVS